MKSSKSNQVNSTGLLLKVAATITFAAALLVSATSGWANTTRSSQLIGHPVVTDSGETLGNVEDLAIDPASGQVSFVVISIGSFLIENSLIAVEPDALVAAADGEPLVLRTDDLEVAHRFNADNWPSAADVRAAGDKKDNATASTADASTADTEMADKEAGSSAKSTPLSSSGTATITAGNRKATYENGKREMVNGPMRRASNSRETTAQPETRANVIPNFKNLDSNRDGRLSQEEIGAQLKQKSSFGDLDADANGSIDDFEYAAYLEQLAKERRWVGTR